jgi:hypothetical protein
LSKVVSDHDKDKNDRPKEKEHSVRGQLFLRDAVFHSRSTSRCWRCWLGSLAAARSSGADHRLIKEDLARAEERKDESQCAVAAPPAVLPPGKSGLFDDSQFRDLPDLHFRPVRFRVGSVQFRVADPGIHAVHAAVGVVSLLGFIVGYDPTRFFDQWLVLIRHAARPAATPDSSTRNARSKSRRKTRDSRKDDFRRRAGERKRAQGSPNPARRPRK